LKLEHPEQPFADQLEWLRHRYDPGYFLGGTLRPELRLWLGPRAKRAAAVLALGWGAGAAALFLAGLLSLGVRDPLSFAFAVVSLHVARKLWRSAAADRPVDTAAEAGSIRRGLVMVLLATGMAAVIGLAVFAALVLATAALRGHAGIAAAIFVAVAVAATWRRRGD
jgi:hypothetical protein